MDQKQITLMLTIALVAFAIYRRVRRTIGRQPFQPKRMQARMAIFGVVGAIALLFSFRNIDVGGAMVAGLVGGAALGVFGVRHTKFETTPKGQFYTPHTYIGLFVTLLLLGRLAYRFLIVMPAMQAAAQADANPYAAFQKSPLTMAIFGIVIGYYIAYYGAVIREMRRTAAILPAVEPPTSVP
jgi:cytochrome b561